MGGTEAYALLVLGALLMLLGALLIATALLARAWPALVGFLQRLPPYILWTYSSDGFTFATSPLLILLSVLALIIYLLRR
ncbi:MAG: hypothetical protein C4339_04005 [Nitrososphaerota archaeon]